MMILRVLFLCFVFSTAEASPFDVLKAEVSKKGLVGNPIFVGDFLSVSETLGVARIFKIPPCADKSCSFDFSSNTKGPDELFTCSLPAGLRINFANNDKGYIFIETPGVKKLLKCSIRLEMEGKNILKVNAISCPQTKIGDCQTDHFLGEFKRMGRPSFDCGVLTPFFELSPARKTICQDLELSATDHELELTYESIESKDDFHKAENKFMRAREACGANVTCLKGLYLVWRKELEGMKKKK
jgi:hypothetical protein